MSENQRSSRAAVSYAATEQFVENKIAKALTDIPESALESTLQKKIDGALQGVRINGATKPLDPDENKIVDVRIPVASGAAPQKAGAPDPGTTGTFSRSNHVHPAETEVIPADGFGLTPECFPITYNIDTVTQTEIVNNAGLRFRVAAQGIEMCVYNAAGPSEYGTLLAYFDPTTLKFNAQTTYIDAGSLKFNGGAPVANTSPTLVRDKVFVRSVEVAKASGEGFPQPCLEDPLLAGDADAGDESDTTYSKGSHVHPAETKVLEYALPASCFPITYTKDSATVTIASNAGLKFISISNQISVSNAASDDALCYFNSNLKYGDGDSSLRFNGVAGVTDTSPTLEQKETVYVRDVQVAKQSDVLGNSGNQTLNGTLAVKHTRIEENKIVYDVGAAGESELMFPAGARDYIAVLSDIYDAVQQIAPEFDATRTEQTKYERYELVSKDGVVYQCTNASGHYGAWNASNWTAKKVSELFLPLTGGEVHDITVHTPGSYHGSIALYTDGVDGPYVALKDNDNQYIFFLYSDRIITHGRAIMYPVAPGALALLQNLAGDFLTSSTYAINDLCVYNNRLYRCTTAHQGAWDNSHFAIATVQDVLTAIVQDALSYTSTTWDSLVNLRDTGKLVPGAQYRITDYTATVNDAMVTNNLGRAAEGTGHPFDLIVTADSTNKLNEVARAIRHQGDTYFPASTKFEAWQVWYCLDNDDSRFQWANLSSFESYYNSQLATFVRDGANDVSGGYAPYCWKLTTDSAIKRYTAREKPAADTYCFASAYMSNPTIIRSVSFGKGVIYRLIDEFNNDLPYDFKGIQFKAYGDNDNVWRYTFDSGTANNNTDYSLLGNKYIYGNTINPYHGTDGTRSLNSIVFKSDNCHSNSFGDGCSLNTFGDGCFCNTFGTTCFRNVFGDGCYNNSFGYGCYDNIFGGSCHTNTFGNECAKNTFGDGCLNSNFGASCEENTIGESCSYITLGDGCRYVTLGYPWTEFSSSAQYSVGDYVKYDYKFYKCTTAHSGAWNDQHFEEESPGLPNYLAVTVESGTEYLALRCTGDTEEHTYQYVTVKAASYGTESETKVIVDPNVDQTFHTTYQPANSRTIEVPAS